MVGKRLRVLLLDFDAKFTLLIPNIEPGKAFRINKADVEVQTKILEGGHKLTFMKFLFQSPQLEIKAPVLNDKEVGYKVLSQNGACVFLKRLLQLPTTPGSHAPGHLQQGHATQYPPVRSQYPPGPPVPGPRPGPGYPRPPHLQPPQVQGHGHAYQNPVQSYNNQDTSPSQMSSPSQGSTSNNVCPNYPSMTAGSPLAPTTTPLLNSNSQSTTSKTSKDEKPKEEKHLSRPQQNFFELYKALNEEDHLKMTTCSFCQRKFRFTSVLIEHMSSHHVNVQMQVEMKLKIWVNGSKLKCTEPGCKKKFAYTLEYTKHRDSHQFEGLKCAECGAEQNSPAEYSAHLKQEHQEHLYSPETHPDDLPSITKIDVVKEVTDVAIASPGQPITPGYSDNHQVRHGTGIRGFLGFWEPVSLLQ